ncbi:MAG: globin [Myxococcales bacterium]|nr:globin [Myxococcales bacterium]
MGQIWLIHSELQRFEDSMHRCLEHPTFLRRFYDRFIGSSPEVAEKFANTNLDRQAQMLEDSLRLVLKAAVGVEAGRDHLAQIAELHSRRSLGIGAHLYQFWLDSLVSVASETDAEWDESLDDVWRAALQPCIDRMIRVA